MQIKNLLSALGILLFGVWLGRMTAPAPTSLPIVNELKREMPAKQARTTQSSLDVAEKDEEGGEETSPLEALISDPRLKMAQTLAEWGGDPTEALGLVIDSMSDRELRLALTSLTNFNDKQLDAVRDMRGFSRRVAEVASDNIYSAGAPPSDSAAEVEFSRGVDDRNAPVSPQDSFGVDGRIYAVFPMDEYGESEVFVKWYRSDNPEILLFDQYQIQRDAEFSYVWLDQEKGWNEGDYVVEFYSADSEMRQLGFGGYRVQGD
jgi:hypothetical protein